MSTLFIANVGTRDVAVVGDAALPQGARHLGEALLADWDQYAGGVEMPILGKALRWVKAQHGPVDRVVLVATDQPATPDNAHFRANDTLPFAQVIARALADKPDWAGVACQDAVSIVPVTGNPSNPDAMMAVFDDLLPTLNGADYSHVYLCVTGGVPAMNFGLLLKGVEHLRSQAELLYISEAQPDPVRLDAGRQMVLNSVLQDIRLSLSSYQYSAALKLITANEGLLRRMGLEYDLLHGLVAYAGHRLNFNFEQAERVLSRIETADSAWVEKIAELREETARMQAGSQAPCAELTCLREVLAAAEVSLRTGAYMSFVGYVYRLTEGLNEVMLRRWAPDLELVGEGWQRQISDGWLAAHPDAQEFLRKKGLENRVSRRLLLELVRFYDRTGKYKQVIDFLDEVNRESDTRNALPLAHGCGGVTRSDALKLVQGNHAGGGRSKSKSEDEVMNRLNLYFKWMTEEDPGPNPFERVNAMIEACLAQVEGA